MHISLEIYIFMKYLKRTANHINIYIYIYINPPYIISCTAIEATSKLGGEPRVNALERRLEKLTRKQTKTLSQPRLNVRMDETDGWHEPTSNIYIYIYIYTHRPDSI